MKNKLKIFTIILLLIVFSLCIYIFMNYERRLPTGGIPSEELDAIGEKLDRLMK